MHEMTGRERTIKAMNFEETDRLPIMANGIGSPDYIMRLTGLTVDEYWADQPAAHYQAMRILGMDFNLQIWFPSREDWAHRDEKDKFDEWSDPDKVAADLERTINEFENSLPFIETSREQKIEEICRYQLDVQAKMGNDLLWIFGMDSHGPAITCFLDGKYGYEGFLLAMALYPELMDKYWRAESKILRIHNECVVEAAKRLDWPKIGYCGADMTDQRGNMVDPKRMAEIYFPHLRYAIEPLVKAQFKLIWHSDGNMNDMIGPLIDIGISGFQGFQEECGTKIADVAKLRNRNGDPLILWGSCSVVDVLRQGKPEDIRHEVQRVLHEWPHPGLCLATSSYISPDVPEENITEFYRICCELGKGRGV